MPYRPNRLLRFWYELKRRRVVHVVVVYASAAIVLIDLINNIADPLHFPGWVPKLVIMVLLTGFPLAIIFSWIFDMTPEGLEKTRPLKDLPSGELPAVSNSWKIATYISGLVIIGLIFYYIFYRTISPGDLPSGEPLAVSNSWKIATYISGAVIIGLIFLIIFSRNRTIKDRTDPGKYIAVLPFDNLSEDSTQLWFTEGISDVISSQLSRISDLRVINRESTNKYKEGRKSISEIGKKLRVEYLITGSVQIHGIQIRIIPKLIRVKSEAILWSDSYDNNLEDIFDIQSDIANKIAHNLHTALSPEEKELIVNLGTRDYKAWELCQKGNHEIKNISDDTCRRAIEYYKQAVALDPGYAQAYAGMANAYYTLSTWGVLKPDVSLVSVAKEYALKALELDENLGEPHYTLGGIYFMHEWNWEESVREYEAGLKLNPNYVHGRNWYATMLMAALRRFEEGIVLSEGTLKLDPLDPTPYLELGAAYEYTGQWDKGYEFLNKCLELYPDFILPKRGLCLYYLHKGENFQFIYDYCDERLKPFNNDFQKTPAFIVGDVGYFMTLTGRKEEAALILAELNRRIDEGEDDVSYLWMGMIYNIMGESEKAIDMLEKGFEVRDPNLTMINSEFTLEPLRSNKRYQDLLRKMGFEI